jgi:hypothetical protein
MMILNYKSKKILKESIGKPLDYTETSMFGEEYKPDGTFCGCNRPYSPEYPKFAQRKGREFFASITMKDGLIKGVK